MDSKVIDQMLELCHTSVEKMATEIIDNTKELSKAGILAEPQKVNKFFHTLGAATGSFLLDFVDETEEQELVGAFVEGLTSFVKYCETSTTIQDGMQIGSLSLNEQPGSRRILNWLIDNPTYYN